MPPDTRSLVTSEAASAVTIAPTMSSMRFSTRLHLGHHAHSIGLVGSPLFTIAQRGRSREMRCADRSRCTLGTRGFPMSSISAFNGRRRVPTPLNEPVRGYAPGSPERASLKARLDAMAAECIDIPLVIGGRRVMTGDAGSAVMPHDHAHVLGRYARATPDHVRQAVTAARDAHHEWSSWAFEDRAGVFLKAAELLTTTWRDTLNAATMLGQSKTVFQAEIDAACEIIDFWRFNVHFAQELLEEQPLSDRTMWNQLEFRALEVLQNQGPIDLRDLNLRHRPTAEPPFADFVEGKQPQILVPIVAHDRVVEVANLFPAALQRLDKDLIADTEQPGDPLRRIVLARLTKDRIEHRGRQRRGGTAGIEKANEHKAVSPGQGLRLMSDRNSRLSAASLRNEPRMTLLIILVASSFTPRQCMQ